MKNKFLAALAIILLSCQVGFAAEKGVTAEFRDLEVRIRIKLQQGNKTEQDLAPEIKEIEALLAKYKVQKTDAVAEILLMEANLYLQVFDNTDKGAELIKKLQSDFPETTQGQDAFKILQAIKKKETAKKIQGTLRLGTKLPEFNEKDIAGKPLSLTNYQGKVVLLDFWGTWCEPWVSDFPSILKIYETYHAKGFEIIGISLDEDSRKLANFAREKNMTWPLFFDGQGWQNKLAVKYGVYRIPASYLLDGEGKIIGKDLRGEALEQALAKALAKP